MNIVTLIGNLHTDVRDHTKETEKRATFVLAVDRPKGDAKDLILIVAEDRQAELCVEYLAKGARVAIDGSIRGDVWDEEPTEDDQDDTERVEAVVAARRVEFLGGAKS